MALLQEGILERFARVSRPEGHRLLLSAKTLDDEIKSGILEDELLAFAVGMVKPISKGLKLCHQQKQSSQTKIIYLIGTLRVVCLESKTVGELSFAVSGELDAAGLGSGNNTRGTGNGQEDRGKELVKDDHIDLRRDLRVET